MIRCHIYRFNNAVAVAMMGDGTGETFYLTAHDARLLAKALHVTSRDIDKREFTSSTLGTRKLELIDGRR